MRLRRKLQFEERKQANQRRVFFSFFKLNVLIHYVAISFSAWLLKFVLKDADFSFVRSYLILSRCGG